jgi:cellulose synthase/poly-beta-1,6-N-acetylglucosamine synthase-like glycosyltransferase
MAEPVFVALLLMVVYCYFGYPALLILIGSLRPNRFSAEGELPTVTLIIVAHNEQDVIEGKLKNSLALDYPREKLEIVVASDASTDRTDQICRAYAGRGVRLIRRPTRGSQTGAQNYAVPRTAGEILVFCDANSMYRPDSLKKLMVPFSEPRVGCVVGRLRHSNPDATSVSFGEELYWRYESFLKERQSSASALFLANGAIYAARRTLYQEVNPNHDHDTIVPLRTAAFGYKVVYQPEALAYEEASESFGGELRRKIRIITRDAWTFIDLKFMIKPFRPWVAFNIISHKVLRWCVGFALIGMFVSNLFLLDRPAFRVILAAQVAFYSVAVVGRVVERGGGGNALARIPVYFCLVNTAGVLAALGLLTGRKMRTWNPRSW